MNLIFFAYGQKKLLKNKKKDINQNLYIYPLVLIVFQYLDLIKFQKKKRKGNKFYRNF